MMPSFGAVSSSLEVELELVSDVDFVLLPDDWNDFGFRTQFVLYARHESKLTKVGRLKILQRGEQITRLPSRFEALDSSFCSVGEDAAYYESISAKTRSGVLSALNDIVQTPAIATGFESDVGFRRSLLRFLPAEYAFETARGGTPLLNFDFSTRLLGFDQDHLVNFNYSDSAFLNRVVLLAGNNGCGKSGLLANLAYALSGERPDAGVFKPQRPLFRQVLVLSYGLFQPFKSIKGTSSGYIYCGLVGGDPREILEPSIMSKRHAQALQILKATGRIRVWNEIWDELCVRSGKSGEGASLAAQLSLLGTMSSGHRIFAQIVVDLLCRLESKTLLLFDEPEIHMHPALAAHLMRTVTFLLEQYDAYAVVATHSPVIVQEIPGSNVRIVDRVGGLPMIATPALETFGATLGEISDVVFRMASSDRNYLTHVKELLKSHSPAELRTRFLSNTSINLDVVLRAE